MTHEKLDNEARHQEMKQHLITVLQTSSFGSVFVIVLAIVGIIGGYSLYLSQTQVETPDDIPLSDIIPCDPVNDMCYLAREFGCNFKYQPEIVKGASELANVWMARVSTIADNRMELVRKYETSRKTEGDVSWDLCWQRQVYPLFALQELRSRSPQEIVCKKDLDWLSLKYYDDDSLQYYYDMRRDYINKDFVADSSKVRIAYLIMARAGQVSLITNLISLIYHTDHYYIIHLDKNEGETDWLDEMDTLNNIHDNIVVLNPRFIGAWGGVSIVYVELAAMIVALNMGHWDFWINLSASDVPATKNDVMLQHLAKSKDKNFMTVHPMGTPKEYAAGRRDEVTSIDVACKDVKLPITLATNITSEEGKLWRLPPPINWSICNTWVIFNRQAAIYLVTSPYVREIITWSRHLHLPEEKVLQSLIITKYPTSIVKDYKRYVNWSSPTGINLNAADIDILKNSEPGKYFFARKMYSDDVMNQYLEWWYSF